MITHRDIAIKLMESIMYDNGWVNRLEPERFSPPWIKKIVAVAGPFFDRNPELVTDDILDEMGSGDYDEKQEKYGHLEGFAELDEVLNEYFETGGGE